MKGEQAFKVICERWRDGLPTKDDAYETCYSGCTHAEPHSKFKDCEHSHCAALSSSLKVECTPVLPCPRCGGRGWVEEWEEA